MLLISDVKWNEMILISFHFISFGTAPEVDPKIGQKIESDAQFTREVIFIKGETSDYINESDKVMINNLFPNAKFYKIPNAGHWLHVDNPIDFLSVLLSLIW